MHEIKCDLLTASAWTLHEQPFLSSASSNERGYSRVFSCRGCGASILKCLEDKRFAGKVRRRFGRARKSEPAGDGAQDVSQHLASTKVVGVFIGTPACLAIGLTVILIAREPRMYTVDDQSVNAQHPHCVRLWRVMYAYSSPPVRHKTGQGFLPNIADWELFFRYGTSSQMISEFTSGVSAEWLRGSTRSALSRKRRLPVLKSRAKEDLVGFAPSIDCFG